MLHVFKPRRPFTTRHFSKVHYRSSHFRPVVQKEFDNLVQTELDVDIDSLKSKSYIITDVPSNAPTRLLAKALEGYLPLPLKSDHNPFCSGWMHLGYQHAFFRPSLTPSMLCQDGTDDKFLPGPESIWRYRLWAGGSVKLHSKLPYRFHGKRSMCLIEYASDVQVVQREDQADKVLVKISRKIADTPVFIARKQQAGVLTKSRSGQDGYSSVWAGLTEDENICFLRERPRWSQDKRKIRPPRSPLYTHTMTPTRSLLFQFSALTYNAHIIHIDRELAQSEYGAQDLVVHGPLTLVLMSEFLRSTLQREAGFNHQDTNAFYIPKSIDYTNVQPLYVDQPLTLCCKPASSSTGTSPLEAKDWTVWIQVGSEDDTSCAVKATMSVNLLKVHDVERIDESHD